MDRDRVRQGEKGRQAHIQIDRQTDRQTGRQTDRQADRHTETDRNQMRTTIRKVFADRVGMQHVFCK